MSRKRARAVISQLDSDPDDANLSQRRKLTAGDASQRRGAQTQAQAVNRKSQLGSEDDVDSDDENGGRADQGDITRGRLVKKLVRLALASEFTRQPIRRVDISSKVLGPENSRIFKSVFEQTQLELRRVFGMELIELPTREKITIAQRRAAQRTERGPSQSTGAYVLTTVLDPSYRIPEILGSSSSDSKNEAYTGLIATICTLIYLNGRSLAETKLDRYLRRLNIEMNTPVDKTEKLLATMTKQGYLIKVKDNTGGETSFEYHLGPRAKVEIGKGGVVEFLEEIYGVQAPEDLALRVTRNIGVDEEEIQAQTQGSTQTQRRVPPRPRTKRGQGDDEEGDDSY